MDDIDRKIKEVLSKELSEPVQYESTIKSALYKENIKRVTFKTKFIKTIGTASVGVLLSAGIAFASYNIYENVWKTPEKCESYSEYQVNEETKKETDEKNRTIELEVAESNDEIISEEKAIEYANEVLSQLGYSTILTTDNIKYDDMDSKYSYNLYYVIKTSDDTNTGIEIKLGADGSLYSFVDRDISLDYDINQDSITEEEAQQLSDEILENLGIKDKYNYFNSINEISHYYGSEEKIEWWTTYARTYGSVINYYETLEISFYLENEELIVEQILTKHSDYELENNEIVIDENTAIDIAKETDREISELEIESIEVELEYRPLNAFVYAQLQSNGTEDELASEEIDDNGVVVYDQYTIDSNVLRKVYNVKINYSISYTDDEPVHNWKEQFGREYYVDCTTGGIIGGRWGGTLY